MLKAYPRHSIRFGSGLLFLSLRELFFPAKEDKVETFEKKFSKFVGTKYAVAVPSARFGLYAGLCFQGWEPGSQVIMPAYTFKGMALTVKAAGFQPVFVDCKYNDCNIDETLIEARINSHTRAILISHMFGIPCDLKKLVEISKKHNLVLIEDCAHTCGAIYDGRSVGSFGRFSVFSFGIGKNIVCLGGGIVATDDEDLYSFIKRENMRLTQPKKWQLFTAATATFCASLLTRQPLFSVVTYPALLAAGVFNINYIDEKCNENMSLKDLERALSQVKKFSAAQAVLGLRQLDGIKEKNAILLRNASRYDALLHHHLNPSPKADQSGGVAATHYYMVRADKRDGVRQKLLFQGIDTKADDMCDCSRIEGFNPAGEEFLNAARAVHELMEIPNNPSLGELDIQYIAKTINRALS
jgi:dTDP-4-amino-4,6-dideoxygalactose transaminase